MRLFSVVFTVFFFFFVFFLNPVKQRKPASSDSSLADRNYRRSFISLDDSFNYSGLTHKPGEDGEYVRRLFGQVIQKAHHIARDYKDAEPSLYYTFLLASLTVPMHESSLMHFTRRDPHRYCYFSNDLLVDIPAGIAAIEAREESRNKRVALSNARFLERNIERFYQAFNQGRDLFMSCEDLKQYDEVQQILFSNDYADIGLMMINSTSHGSFFRAGKILHVDEVLDYGLNYLFDGFEEISLNASNYACLNVVQDDPAELYKRIIRGAWAGKYNSGQVGQTCRFTNSNHRFAANDRGFIQKLNSIFERNSLYHQYLPVDSLERNFFSELIAQYYDPQSLDSVLEEILEYNYHDTHQEVNETEPEIEIVAEEEEIEEQPEASTEVIPEIQTPEVAEERPLPEVMVEPEPVQEIIPNKEFETFQGRFRGSDINLRILPEVSSESYCTNTKYLSGNPSFRVIGSSGDFYEIEPNEFFESDDSCWQANSLFVHSDFVELVEEQVTPQKQVRLNSWVSLRDQAGMRSSVIVGTQGPDVLTIVEERLFANEYLWLSFIDSAGNQVWFYAGSTGQFKFEELP